MENGFIVISATVDYGHYCMFNFTVSTDHIQQSLSLFGYTDTFDSFGKLLMDFPTDTAHEVLFQESRDDGKGPGYLSIKAYCYDNQGLLPCI
jgi:hypothetical protein